MPSPFQSPSTSKPTAVPEVDPAKKTLLIADDEEGPRQSLRVVFKGEYNLLLASDPLQAIDLAEHNKIDAAILDIRMTGMSGIELLERLKAIDRGIEVIMLTAYETNDTIRQALRLGACDYLNKPFDITTIRKAVSTAMERRSLSDEIRTNVQKLNELQTDLQNQRLQEEITRTRGEIYASIVHDINAPLTIISGFIQMISQKLETAARVEGEDLEMVRDRLKRIIRQVSNCAEISRRYLSFMRQNAVVSKKIHVNQLLDDLQELLKAHPAAQKHRLTITKSAEDAILPINGTDLIQILLNLAINAFQSSTEPLDVTIAARQIETPLDPAQMRDGPHERWVLGESLQDTRPLMSIVVRDNGPGIPSEIIPKIFEPYFTTKSADRGTGLGLSIVQRLLKEAQGALHLQSEPSGGAKFTLYFPIRQNPQL